MGNLAGIVTAELHGYCGTNKAVLGWLMVGPSLMAGWWLCQGKAGLRYNVCLMLAPSWPKHSGTWTFLDRNQCVMAGGGEWEAIERVTWHQGKATLQVHHLSNITRKVAPFTSEPSFRETSTQKAVTLADTVCPAMVDSRGHQTLPLDQGPFLPLCCTGRAPPAKNPLVDD